MAKYSPIQYGVVSGNGTTVSIHSMHRAGDILLVIARLRNNGKDLGVPPGWNLLAHNYGEGHSVVLGSRVAESSSETSGTWESDLLTSIVVRNAESIRPWRAGAGVTEPIRNGIGSFWLTAPSTSVYFGGLPEYVPPTDVGAAVHHLVYGDTFSTSGIAVPSGFTNLHTTNIATWGVRAFSNTGAAVPRPSVAVSPGSKTCGMSIFILPKKLTSSAFIPFFT